MAVAKAFYFLFFGAMACVVPFLTLQYQNVGLSGREIGTLTGVVPLVAMVAGPLWGMLADATGHHRSLFLLAMVGTWISVFLMSGAGSFLMLIPIVIIYAIFTAPIIPLVDDAVIEWLGSGEYGVQRVWGSYGWGLTGAVIGTIIAASGLSWAFVAFLIVFFPLFFIGMRLPMRTARPGSNFRSELSQLLSNRGWLIFLGVALIEGMTLGIFLNYVFLYLKSMGVSTAIMGLTLTMATLSEIPIFLYSKRLLNRWSAQFLLAASLIFTVLRSLAYIRMTAPWQVLLISLFHGPTFTLMWVAGVTYSAESAPPGLGATAQAVFSGVAMGLGTALGGIAGGFLYDAYGPLSVFYFAGLSTLAATVVFVWLNRRAFRQQMQTT